MSVTAKAEVRENVVNKQGSDGFCVFIAFVFNISVFMASVLIFKLFNHELI